MLGVTEYITHHDFNELALCGNQLNIPYGTSVYDISSRYHILATADGKLICLSTSENGKRHFAINNDEKGLERGALTYKIAFSKEIEFSDEDIEMLRTEYADWLQLHSDVILFNDNFFVADIDDLKKLLNRLNKIK